MNTLQIMAAAGGLLAAASTLRAGAAVHDAAFLFRAGLLLLLGAWLRQGSRSGGVAAAQPAPAGRLWAALPWQGPLALLLPPALWGWWRAEHFFAGLEGAFAWLWPPLIYALVGACVPRQRRTLLAGAVALGCLQAAWALAQRFLGQSWRGHGGFFNPNDLAAYLAPATLLALRLGQHLPGRRRRTAQGAAALCAAGVAATASRSGLVALACGLLGGLRVPARGRGGARWARTLLWAGLLAGGTGAALALRHAADAQDPLGFARLQIWRTGVALVAAHPWGLGFGGVASALATQGVAVPGPVRYPAQAHNAHSELLQAGLELGLPGLLWPLLAVAVVGAGAARRPRFGARAAAWITFVLPALVGASLHQPPITTLAAAWAAADAPVRPPVRTTRGRTRRLGRAGGRRPRRRAATGTGTALSGLAAAALVALTAPAAVAHLCAQRAQTALAKGRAANAHAWLNWAVAAAPWDLGHQLHRLDLSARHAAGAPEAGYLALAQQFPRDSAPLQRLAELRARRAQQLANAGPARAVLAAAWRDAATAWAAAAARRPRTALLWTAAGEAWLQANEPALAHQHLTRALAAEPHCARALWALGQLAGASGAPEEQGRLEAAARAAQALATPAATPGAYARAVLALPGAAL